MRRIISFTLTALLILIQPFLICNADSQKKEKITVSTAEQLEKLSKQCSLDSFSVGLTVELADDIDLSGSSFTGIPYFCGTFDGCGHTFKHFNISQEGSNIGFFRYTSKDARIRNIKIEGTVEPGGSANVVGGITGENNGVISGCSFSGTVKAIESVGGIAGKNTGVISSCKFSGSVSGEHQSGGIAGENSGTISGCTNSGKIDTTLISVSDKKSELTFSFDVSDLTEDDFLDITDIGGISGWSDGIISSCKNEGSVGYERIGYNIGGIVGRQSGRVAKCTNEGTVIGRKDVGGIVGQAEPYSSWDISETTLKEFEVKLSDIQKKLKAFNNGLKDNSSGIKSAAKNLGTSVDAAAADTAAAIDVVSGNVSQAKNTANDLISMIDGSIDNKDSASAKKLIDKLKDYVKKSPSAIDVSKLTDLLEKLRSQESDHDLTISIKSDLEKTIENRSTNDTAKAEISGKTVKELTADIETAIDSQDVQRARELADELLSLAESGTEQLNKNSINKILKDISELEGSYINEAGSLYNSVEGIITSVSFNRPDVYKLKSDADNIAASAGELRSLLSNSSGSMKKDAKSVLDACSSLADILSEVKADGIQLQTDYQTDISSLDSDKYSSGVVISSKNYGEISADTNVGGVAGNVACEVDIDVEDQLKLPAYMLQNARYVVFSVISECTSNSDVTAKKECAGGIVGNADFGIITGCECSGSMYGGDYCGGIAGKSLSSVSDSYSRCLLYGDTYVGGVVGEGCDVSNCCSYSYVKSEKEYCGSIAGKANGTVEGCVFVQNDIGGIDGISYAGSAEPISYTEMAKLPNVPEWFKKITVTFVAGNETIDVKEVDFGGSIDELPKVEMDGTRYWKWNDFENSHIYYSQTVEGEYKDPKTTISTSEDVPLFLAEGNFYEGQELKVASKTDDIKIEGERGKLVGIYTLSVNSSDTVLRFRMKAPDKGSLYTYSDGKWIQIDYKTDGSYIVFDVENNSTIALFSKLHSNIPIWAIITGAVSFVVLIAAIVIRFKRKKAKKK